ncbi:zinc finger protein 699-like [Sitodiplosis mosellana]|uniref:zinc finger protein 699-like n=1 Tax=Sitodiplosis mosellana TaxID=263140 RepID=UPI002444C39A|nr:zinc finger protein 699-like [Sitodiplosis mosellana]
MNSELFILIKKHCQNIIDVVCRLENSNNGRSVDRSTVLEELSSCVTAFNSLGEKLQLAIDQLGETESNEHQTEDEILIINEEENWEWSSDGEFNPDDYEKLCELICTTFDDTMTLENLLKYSHDKRTNTSGEHIESDFDNDQATLDSPPSSNMNKNIEVPDKKDSSSNNIETNSIDLKSDTVVSTVRETMNGSLTFQVDETVMAADEASDSGEAACTEPKRKRKWETISDIDFERGRVLSKQSRQTNEHVNVLSAVTILNEEKISNDGANDNEDDQSSDNSEPVTSTQFGIEDNVEYENVEFLEDDTVVITSESDGDTDLSDLCISNTNREIHCKNSFYNMVCLLCGKNDPFISKHYMEDHPDCEVLVARTSPQMAERLRLQNDRFEVSKKGKITGICFFCEETKTMQRSCWEEHILMHTGEKPFACVSCNTSFVMAHHRDDKICNSEAVNIFLANSTDRSLVGFCCKECNYLQIEPKRMIVHLANEHGFECPTENYHYEKLTLVPAGQRNTTQSASIDSSSISTQAATSSNLPNGKSVTFILPNGEDDEDETQHCRNTNPDVHYKNQSTCVLCGVEDPSLAYHYTTCHPKYEVYVARPSPQMADKLRSQVEQFAINENGKMVGLCYFCGDTKTMDRFGWRAHILKHTGEKIFSCERCAMEVNYRKQHDSKIVNKNKCDGELIDICEANSSDGSYVGFICIECNYVQMRFDRIIKHLTNQHDYDSPVEDQHYQKCTLLPSTRAEKSGR